MTTHDSNNDNDGQFELLTRESHADPLPPRAPRTSTAQFVTLPF